MNGCALEVFAVSKSYSLPIQHASSSIETNLFPGLCNITFSLKKGISLGILGNNGAGKSTLLKLIAGVLKPDRGQITISGRCSSILELGSGFISDLTGLENLEMCASLYGLSSKEFKKLLPEILNFAEIGSYINLPLKYYSSGMQLRLAFSSMLLISPDILLLDEVLSVGDITFKQKCQDKILEMVQNGMSLILVSHNLSELELLCDDAVILEKGQLLYNGPMTEAIETYFKSSISKDPVYYPIEYNSDTAISLDNTYKALTPVISTNTQHVNIRKYNRESFDIAIIQNAVVYCKKRASNEVAGDFCYSEPIVVSIEFELIRHLEQLDLVMTVFNHKGAVLTDSVRYREDYKPLSLTPGRYTYTAIIPECLLYAGHYHIGVFWGNGKLPILKMDNATSFQLKLDEWERHKPWIRKEDHFTIKPKLIWQVANSDTNNTLL